MEITNLEKKYIDLWKMRELVLTVNPKMGWEAYFELSKRIHKAIGDYFRKIENLEYEDKVKVYDKLNAICSRFNKEDNLFERVIRHFNGDSSGGRKFLLNVCISTRSVLFNEVKLIDFDLRKELENCNCSLKQEIGLRIPSKPSKDIIAIEKFTDGYYEYELHQCMKCNTFWINDLYSDDGPAKGWRKPIDKYEFEMIEKSLNRKKK